MTTMRADPGLEEATMAVAAHGLLSPVSAIYGFAELLAERWEDMSEAARREHLGVIMSEATFVAEVLKDLVRGLPTAALDALDALGDGPGHQQ
jgi:signal transduction histidine kinase